MAITAGVTVVAGYKLPLIDWLIDYLLPVSGDKDICWEVVPSGFQSRA